MKKREEVLNVLLAQCLAERGVVADPETILQQEGRQMPDVLFMYQGLRCIIEGKLGDVVNAKGQVQNDAMRRVDTGIAHISIGVVYPGHLREAPFAQQKKLLQQINLDFIIYTENGAGPWHQGRIDDLLAELKRQHQSVISDDVVTRAVTILYEGMEHFTAALISSPAVCDRMAGVLGLGESKKEKAKIRSTSTQIGALTLINALVFHEQLSLADGRVKPLNVFIHKTDIVSDLAEHWSFICDEINYVPIFQIARNVLISIPVNNDMNKALRDLIGTGLRIVAERAALRHDLMGRIYHRLLLEAKYLGTYYTSVSAATLLSKLALVPGRWNVDWSDPGHIKKFQAADLACGTGTLLMAVSQAITDNFVRQTVARGGAVTESTLKKVHQALMEEVLRGYDVLASAVHLTASSLAMLAPEIAFQKMQLFILPLGKMNDGTIRLGSIDYLKHDSVAVQMSLIEEMAGTGAERISGRGAKTSGARMPLIDLAIMNPPFVRSVGGNLLFGSVNNRASLQTELSRVLKPKGLPAIRASSTAGLGSVFVAVADPYIKAGGRIALVLPAALATGVSWKKTRELIASKYLLEYVVSSHDPDKWSFSENTDLSEILVVARKKQPVENGADHQTVFFNLWKNPRSAANALAVGESLLAASPASLGTAKKPEHAIASVLLGDNKFGEALAMPWKEVKTQPWMGAAFAQTALLRTAWFLRKGFLHLPGARASVSLPVCKLSELGDLGPDCRDIHDGFTKSDSRTPYPAFWSHTAELTRTIEMPTNAYLAPLTKAKTGRPKRDISLLWPKAAGLMIAERMRFTSQSLFCVRLNREALSNVWWPFRLNKKNEDWENILSLWFNSTIGLINAAASRVPTEGPWVKFKKPLLNQMPVLEPTSLSKKDLKKLSSVYDSVRHEGLQPIAHLDQDPVRRKIDDAFCSVLGIKSLEPLAQLLASEPVICGRFLL